MRGDGVAGFGSHEADAADDKFSITLPLAGGLLPSRAITLYLAPVVYLYLEKLRPSRARVPATP